MLKLKTLYIRNIVQDLLAKKKTVALFIGLFAVLFAYLGIRQCNAVHTLSEEQQQEIADYQSKLDEYDAAVADVEKNLEELEKQLTELQEYVDHSIYMQLDPQNIQVVSTQYGIQTEGNIGNIYNSFITFINDGGMKESLPEESKDLDVQYWRDILGVYQAGNVLTITVLHYDAGQAQRIMDIVKQRIQEYIPQVEEVQGAFTLLDMGTSAYVKADVNIVNGQNGHRNNLRGFINARGDLHNKLVSTRNNRDSFIENNEPEVLEAPAPGRTTVIKYMLVGILFGIVISCAVICLRYILSDRLRSAKDLKDSSLNVLGTCGAGGNDRPGLERVVMDIQALAEDAQLTSVYLNDLSGDPLSSRISADYVQALTEAGLPAQAGSGVSEDAGQLKKLIASKGCVLLAQAGRTTYQQLEQQLQLCARFKVTVLGCVVIE